MTTDKSLKESNSPLLHAYVLVHAVFIGWVVLRFPGTAKDVASLAALDWSKAVIAIAMGLPTTVLNRFVGSDTKARLVFWRYRHPYPGSRAFSEIARMDPRLDISRLRVAVGGDFPTDPTVQNAVWYRLSLKHGDDPRVLSSHKDFLLLRDTAWLSLLLTLVGPGLILSLVGWSEWWTASWYAIACFGIYLLIRIVAVTSGERFVSNVLACAASAAEAPTSSI